MPLSPYLHSLRQQIGQMLILSPGAVAVIFNEQNEVLLQLRSDDGRWGLPGGSLEPGEEPAEAVVREVREETGLEVFPERIVGIYSGADSYYTYPDGNQVAFLSIVFTCRVIGGQLRIDQDESLALRYYALDNLPESLFSRHRRFIQHAGEQSTKSTGTCFRYEGKVIHPL